MASNNFRNSTGSPAAANRPGPAPAEGPAPRPPRGNTPRPAPEADAPARPPGPAARSRGPAASPAKPRGPRRPLPGLRQLTAWLRDRRFHLLIGFGLLLGALYLTIAFTSFLLSGRADQSVVAALGTVPVKEAGPETGNWLGLLGAWLAEKAHLPGLRAGGVRAHPDDLFSGL